MKFSSPTVVISFEVEEVCFWEQLLREAPSEYLFIGDFSLQPVAEKSLSLYKDRIDNIFTFLRHLSPSRILVPNLTMFFFLRKQYPMVLHPLSEALPHAYRESPFGRLALIDEWVTYEEDFKALAEQYAAFYQPEEKDRRALSLPIWEWVSAPLLRPCLRYRGPKRPETRKILRNYLRKIRTHHVDTLLLGQSFYTKYAALFAAIARRRMRIIDPFSIMVETLKRRANKEKHYEIFLYDKKPLAFLVSQYPHLEFFLKKGRDFPPKKVL